MWPSQIRTRQQPFAVHELAALRAVPPIHLARVREWAQATGRTAKWLGLTHDPPDEVARAAGPHIDLASLW